MENKLLRLCNKIHKSHFNLVEVIILLEKDSCTLCCLNRNHTVFLEMDVDLDYFQGKYNVSNTGIYFVRPENIIAQSLDLKKEYQLSEFERVHLLSIQRCHHFFHEDHHETSFKEFKNIAQSEFGNVLIQCNGFQSVFSSLYLNEPLFPGKSASLQMNKICEILGTPNQNDWPEGYDLAKEINYTFPQYRGKKLKNVIKNASDSAINLLELMLNFNPSKRPSAIKCLQHPFFQCYEVLRFYGIKFNTKEENNSDDRKENTNNNANMNNFALSMKNPSNQMINNEQFKGDMNDSFGNNDNKNQTFKNGSKFEEFLTNN